MRNGNSGGCLKGVYGGVCHCTYVAFGQVKENTQVGDAAVEMIRNGSIQEEQQKKKHGGFKGRYGESIFTVK